MAEANDYTNSLSYSVPFEYPEESGSLSEHERIEYEANQRLQEFLGKFLSLVIPSHNPRLTCVAFAYACGYPVGYLLGSDNTMTDISLRLGVTKQSLSIAVKKVSKQFDIKTNTGISHEKRKVYQDTNYRSS